MGILDKTKASTQLDITKRNPTAAAVPTVAADTLVVVKSDGSILMPGDSDYLDAAIECMPQMLVDEVFEVYEEIDESAAEAAEDETPETVSAVGAVEDEDDEDSDDADDDDDNDEDGDGGAEDEDEDGEDDEEPA